MLPNQQRRSFIKNAAIGVMAGLAIPDIVNAAFKPEASSKISLLKDEIVLFQGDSITDATRDRKQPAANTTTGMGYGYALLAGSDLLLHHPNKNLQIYNRGISGDKVYQLADRWDAECLQIKPTVLSILIGVNDYWAVKKHGYTGTIETYTNDYKKLLECTKNALPGVKLIIGEPFAVKGVKEVDESWYPKFDEFRAAAKAIAQQFGAVFIPYQAVFDRALSLAPGNYWTVDGVHPNLAGANLMAHAWLQAVK